MTNSEKILSIGYCVFSVFGLIKMYNFQNLIDKYPGSTGPFIGFSISFIIASIFGYLYIQNLKQICMNKSN
jgi:hypothetical protein